MSHLGALVLWLGTAAYIMSRSDKRLNLRRKLISLAGISLAGGTCHYLSLEQYGFGYRYYLYVVLGFVLLVLSVLDYFTYLLPMEVLLLGYLACLSVLVVSKDPQWYLRVMIAVLTFGVIYGAGKLLRGGIGDGDAHVTALLVLGLGWTHGLVVVLVALLISALLGIGLMVFGGKSKKTVLPFVPFMTAAHIGLLFF